MFKTPVLLIIFNRPDYTMKVMEGIKLAKPKNFFIAADGPRNNKEGEKEICENLRKAVLDFIDWECNVHTNFQDENLGCAVGVSTAITWFFDNVEEGIIIEDDCVPNKSFFYFCEKMLEYYRDDQRVSMIAGTSFLPGDFKNEYSYYFNNGYTIWGWATWKRFWDKYDVTLKDYPLAKKAGYIESFYANPKAIEGAYKVYDFMYEGNLYTWDVQLSFYCEMHHTLSISPIKNLVSNIGEDGVHIRNAKNSPSLNRDTFEIDTENLKHPPFMVNDTALSNIAGETRYPPLTWKQKWKNFRRNKLLQIKLRPNEKVIRIFGIDLLRIEPENDYH